MSYLIKRSPYCIITDDGEDTDSYPYEDLDNYIEGHLVHHGILGMKWGVRRYQNADGSLTDAGKKRYDKVASNDRMNKRDTKIASRIARKTVNYQSSEEKYQTKKASRYKRWADSEFDPIKREKHIQKMTEAEDKAAKARSIKEEYSKLYKDINEGNIKAGKDFIVQRDFEFHLLRPVSQINMYKALTNNPNQEYNMDYMIGLDTRNTLIRKK